jgi:hypothetical protein
VHGVPVHWDEYTPLQNDTQLQICAAEPEGSDYIAQIHTHGLYARVNN